MRLTPEQKEVVKKIKHSEENIQTLGGFAGTGKTTVVKALSQLFPNHDVCAFTGKAANILRRKGLTDARTIHSLIYQPVMVDDKLTFELKADLSNTGFIVDEASMVSQDIYHDLLSFGKPIVFVGDHGQLEPVGSSVNIMADPDYKLETIHRNAGPIAHFAEHIRKGNSASTFQGGSEVELVDAYAVTDDLLASVDQTICAYNKTRVSRNNQIRKILGYEGLINVGEKVMCLRNNRNVLVFNGMQGIVTKIHPKKPLFSFDSYGTIFEDIKYDRNQFGKEKSEFNYDGPNPFDYGYCITCHKSQGDEWDSVLVFEQICDKWDHKRWAYTAASRAKEKVYWAMNKRYIPASMTGSGRKIPDWLK